MSIAICHYFVPFVARVDGGDISASATYPEGLTSIGFQATDSSGNRAYCTANLNVKGD